MRDQQSRDAGFLQHMQRIIAHFFTKPRIQAGKSLIQQQHGRAGCQRAGQCHALLLPA